jgi:serine/threonine protein kinase
MTDLVGRKLGRYELVEQLGEGGMATVYKARDTRLGRYVAVKVIRMSVLHSEKFLKRFDREARALARLSHPNIVDIHDYGEEGNTPYLVMEYLSGGTLKEKMGRPISCQQAARMLLPIAEALAYAHQRDIIHRDIKPANILYSESNRPMLSDFGISKVSESEQQGTELTGFGVGIGTPEYMAPEQGQGINVDHRADIYALGVVLYELLTGQKPFQADTPMGVVVKHISEPLPDPRTHIPTLPDQAAWVVCKALEKKAENRFSTMDEFSTALSQIATLPAVGATTTLQQTGELRQPPPPTGSLSRPSMHPTTAPAAAQPPPVQPKKKGRFLAFSSGVLIASVVGIVLCIGLLALLAYIGSDTQATPTTEMVAGPITEPTLQVLTTLTPRIIAASAEPQSRLLMKDDFENQLSGWEVGNFTNGAVGYRNGVYLIEATEKSITIWGAANRSFSDLILEVEGTQITAPLDNDNDYGVGCRVQKNGDGYFLLISGDGFYSIYLNQNDLFTPLVDWQQSEIIRQGNTSNKIRAVCVGTNLELIVNNTLLAQVNDTTFKTGDIALTATTYGAAPVEIHFDHLTVIKP